jgi:rhodanese-related sulfurtransferase
MNQFFKTNSLWLSLLGLAVVIVLLTFIFRPGSPHYKIGASESLRVMNDLSNMVSVKEITGKQLIDIRSQELYSQGHPENAINIPIRQLLDQENLELLGKLSESGKVTVLYGSDELQVTAPLFLLQQLGYRNVKMLKGGLSSTNEFKESEPASTEVSAIDTAEIHRNTVLQKMPSNIPEKQKGEAVIPVRKEASAGGGC